MERTKRELRKQYIAARQALGAEARAAASARIAGRIAALPAYRRASTVMIYRAARGEADPELLLGDPASAGKRFVYPCCVSDTEMKAVRPGAWRGGMYGLEEPDAEASEEVPPEEIDFIVCPGAAFDGGRTRLGSGRGYYDRFLPKCAGAEVVMAAFEAQRAPELPRSDTDYPMDRIVTEDGVY